MLCVFYYDKKWHGLLYIDGRKVGSLEMQILMQSQTRFTDAEPGGGMGTMRVLTSPPGCSESATL